MRDHDEQLRRYLLGKLEAEEGNLLEERLLRDEDFLETAEAVEADLLDDYAHGRLAPADREHVELRLASSPQSRSRLAVIQGLGRIADRGNVIEFPRRKLSSFERMSAIAAMLTVAVLGSWLALQTSEPVRPPQVAGDPVPASPAPLAPPAATPLPPRDVIAESTPPETPVARIAAPLVLKLAVSTLRGDGLIPKENVPPDTERVQLHLLLDDADKDYYTSFRAAVRGAGPELRVTDLEPARIDGKWTLVVELDPKLPEGMYEVEVAGVTGEGEVEQIALKELEIQRNASATAVTPD